MADYLVTIINPELIIGAHYQFFSQQLLVSGGFPPYTWRVANGTLPLGLSLSTSGYLSAGTLGADPGYYPFEISVEDVHGIFGTKLFNFIIKYSVNLDLVAGPLPVATKNKSYSYIFTTTPIIPPSFIKYELASGTLPQGVTLNVTTGELSGIPTELGTYKFNIKASN